MIFCFLQGKYLIVQTTFYEHFFDTYLVCRTHVANVEATEAGNTAGNTNPSGMDLDLPVDPNEPTYCFCNQVSYGEMVACDNPDVC